LRQIERKLQPKAKINEWGCHMRLQEEIHGTTVLALKKDGKVVFAADGQVTIGEVAFKHTANKLRRMRDGKILAGYAGAAADALALFERLEGKLDEYSAIWSVRASSSSKCGARIAYCVNWRRF